MLVESYEKAIAGLSKSVKVCSADAESEKDDARKEDFLVLARLSQKAADRLLASSKKAAMFKEELEKTLKEAERDRIYFRRAAQVVKLVRDPLERESVFEEFIQRIHRYQQNRETFRKIMREFTDGPQLTPPAPPIKISSSPGGKQYPAVPPMYVAGVEALDRGELQEAKGHFTAIVQSGSLPSDIKKRAEVTLTWLEKSKRILATTATSGRVSHVSDNGLVLMVGLGSQVSKGDRVAINRSGFPALVEVTHTLRGCSKSVISLV